MNYYTLDWESITSFNLDNPDESLTTLLVRWAVQVPALCNLNICKIRAEQEQNLRVLLQYYAS